MKKPQLNPKGFRTLFLIVLSGILLSFNFINVDINKKFAYDHKETFDPSLAYLNSVDRLELYIDSIVNSSNIPRQTVDHVIVIKDAIKARFYHGFSHYTVSENWIASFSEKIMGYGLDSKVKTEDIMKNPYAACSQQSMVMMDILRRNKISYRSVGFPHHYALEVLIDGKWYYFDPNMEPNMTKEERLESSWKCCADNLKKYYDTSRFNDLDWKFGKNLKVTTGMINEIPAGHAKIFHTATALFSRIMWCLPLLIAVYKSRSIVSAKLKKLWLLLTNNLKPRHWNPQYKANSLT